MYKLKKNSILLLFFIFVVLILINLFYIKPTITGNIIKAPLKIEPLNEKQKQIFFDVVKSNQMIKEIPEKQPIKITFFNFKNGERIWSESYLLGNSGFLEKGNPTISVILHSEYIERFEKEDFCTVLAEANKNKDLGIDSKHNQVVLLWKYKNLLKYRTCLNF